MPRRPKFPSDRIKIWTDYSRKNFAGPNKGKPLLMIRFVKRIRKGIRMDYDRIFHRWIIIKK